ncbi:MAG: hypothetical protein MUO50_02075 [Longimicrobiales bacterium]|nr:hypothetical protein [Longimicrobiales bacterium]
MRRNRAQRRHDGARSLPHAARFGALVVWFLAACQPGESVGDSGSLTMTPADVHVVGSSEAIAQVIDLEVLPDGSTWLLNSVEPYFIGFDEEGGIIGLHGSSGGGPEEFRRPAGLLTNGLNDEAWAFDFVRNAFIRISEPDEPWSQIDLPSDEIPPGTVRGGMNIMSNTVRTARLGDELIIPWTTGTLESGLSDYHMALLRANLAALDPRTGSARNVVTLGEILEDPSIGFVATVGGIPLWYRLWAPCGEHLRVYDRVRNQLRGFTGSGQEIGFVDLPPSRLTEVTPLEFARAVFPLRQAEVTGAVGSRLTPEDSVRLLNQMAQQLEGRPEQLAAYLPRYVDFRCSEDGTMWLQPIDLEVGGLKGGPAWLRITSEGDIREVLLPVRFDAFRFTRDRVWGVQRDELDIASVAWIEVPPR